MLPCRSASGDQSAGHLKCRPGAETSRAESRTQDLKRSGPAWSHACACSCRAGRDAQGHDVGRGDSRLSASNELPAKDVASGLANSFWSTSAPCARCFEGCRRPGTVILSSTGVARPVLQWTEAWISKRILVAFDAGPFGDRAAERHVSEDPRARRMRPPDGYKGSGTSPSRHAPQRLIPREPSRILPRAHVAEKCPPHCVIKAQSIYVKTLNSFRQCLIMSAGYGSGSIVRVTGRIANFSARR